MTLAHIIQALIDVLERVPPSAVQSVIHQLGHLIPYIRDLQVAAAELEKLKAQYAREKAHALTNKATFESERRIFELRKATQQGKRAEFEKERAAFDKDKAEFDIQRAEFQKTMDAIAPAMKALIDENSGLHDRIKQLGQDADRLAGENQSLSSEVTRMRMGAALPDGLSNANPPSVQPAPDGSVGLGG